MCSSMLVLLQELVCDRLSHRYDSCTKGCCRGLIFGPSDPKAGVLTNWPSCSPTLRIVLFCRQKILHLHEIVEGLYFHCSLSVCLCVYVCVSVCLCVRKFLWTKFEPNGCTDLNAVFAKWLFNALAQSLLKLVTLGQRSRSQWRNTHFSLWF